MEICGKCLHDKEAHSAFNHNGKFMYCANCNKLCAIDEYNIIHIHDKQILYGASMLK